MTVVLSSASSSPCRLAYQNLLEQGTVTPSSEDAEYPVENCFNWISHDYFRPAAPGIITIDLTLSGAASANYLAFYNQELFAQGGSIKLQYHDGSGYVDASAEIFPTTNAPRVVFFDSQTATQWRVVITCAEIFNIGVISFGEYLALPFGMYLNWTPPQLADDAELLNSVSERGVFLGRSEISQGVMTAIKLQYASDTWVRQYWPNFRDHAKAKPFFLVPHAANYPNESVFCWVEGNKMPKPEHTHYGFMGCNIPIRGLIE